ncbi:hypothetical protein BGZ47_009246 [Haplosporangium gracile]|nr:hypothetical protein BGZ47_009246 [Haplosporangium gracile]
MSSASSVTISTSVVGTHTYTLPTKTDSFSPNPHEKGLINPDHKPSGYQRSTRILIIFSCLILIGAIIGSALYWFRYRAKWRLEEKGAFEIVYPRDKAKTRTSRVLDGDGEGDGVRSAKRRWSVQRPESAVVVEGEKGSKRVALSNHQLSNNNISNNRPQSQQQRQQRQELQPLQQHQQWHDEETVLNVDDEVVKIEIEPGQRTALEAERWMEDDRQRYQKLCELTKSPVFVQQHQALLLQEAFQPHPPVIQSSPSYSQSLHSQSSQSQQQPLLQQQQLLVQQHQKFLQQHQQSQEQQQQEQHKRQQKQQQMEQQETPARKPWQLPLGLYDQLFRKKGSALLSRVSSRWAGGMDSLSPALMASHPPLSSLLASSAAPSAVSTMPLSVDRDSVSTPSLPPPGLSRLTIVNILSPHSYPPPPSATPSMTTPVRPFRIKIGGAHCLTPDSTTPSPSSSSAPSSLSTVVASSTYQPSLRSVPIMDSPTQPWKNMSAFDFPTPLSTASLSFLDDGVRTPQSVSVSPIENASLPRGITQFRRFYDLDII